jgi:hypothetical protein
MPSGGPTYALWESQKEKRERLAENFPDLMKNVHINVLEAP